LAYHRAAGGGGAKARLCVIGPLIGANPGHVTTQGEILARQLRLEGYPVIAASSSPNRYRRLADIAATLVRDRDAYDVLLLQVYGGPSFVVEDLASQLARHHGKRVIMHLRGGALPDFFARHPRWARRVLARADLLLVPSDYLRDALARLGFAAQVIPNVIDLGLYPFRARSAIAPRLLWMRSFHPLYNPLMAVRVLAALRRSHPDASLVMAGQEKGMGEPVRAEARRLGVDGAVRFPGFLDAEGKRREGSTADVFINTNDIDNTPVAVIEACAMGLPVVATDVGGLSRLLEHERTGLLVPPGDEAAMTGAVRRLLAEPALVERLTTAGRALAEQCAWTAAAPAWHALLAAAPVPADAVA
jgi:glycosyltransferase involved in cell wall biosynthesis